MNEVELAIAKMDLDEAVLKVQIHAGGRGKAGGVKIAKSREEIIQYAEQLLLMRIVNNQTGKEGVIAHQILISPLVDIVQEYYLGAVIDRQKAQAMLIASPEGGMEIEEIAKSKPDKILTTPIPLMENCGNTPTLLPLESSWKRHGDLLVKGMEIIESFAESLW